jgi:hypothetical protein
MLRGLVMVIMALDHVRDFWSDRFFREDPTDLTKTTAAIFLTRWITHYCAPTFIFLAGTGAFLSGTRGKSKPELSWFLFTRGLWLAFFEVVINRMMWMCDGLVALADAPWLRSLRDLGLAQNEVGDAALQSFFAAAPLENLEVLNLDAVGAGDKAITALAKSLL